MFGPRTNNLTKNRELVFLILSGFFLGSMTMLNVLGTSKILDLGVSFYSFKMLVPVGVLAYPITFLCTDLISELYGKSRANALVWVGLLVNIWLLLILKLGASIPAWDNAQMDYTTFDKIKAIATDTVVGSMLAYFCAQFLDVYIFHYFKDKTKGKKLWLRNNASTMISQLVDTLIVILYVHYANDGFHMSGKPLDEVNLFLITTIGSTYLFKFCFALLDTIPFYILTKFLKRKLVLTDNYQDF
jgi:queuosine precursor transporter